MGDGEKTPLKLNFDSKVRLEFRGVTITSDAGLLACRELDDALGLTDSSAEYLKEGRTGKNILHKLIPLLRQSIYSRLAGYDDTNDADRLSQDPAMRVVVGWKGPDRKAASTSEMSRFETELLTQKDNRKGLEQPNVEWVKRGVAKTVHRRIILDIDSSESPVHGQQEGAAYNGHFECMCYHPLFCFNQFGDCEGAVLRPGNVHSADGWEGFIDPIVERYLKLAVRLLFRADAAFAKPELYEYMEARRIGYAIRLPANDVLQREIAHLLEATLDAIVVERPQPTEEASNPNTCVWTKGMTILQAVGLPPDTAIGRTSDASARRSWTPLATSGIRRAGGLWNGRWHGSPSAVRSWSGTTRRQRTTSVCYSSHVRSCGSGDSGVWPF